MLVVPYLFFYAMAPTAGFEPTTDRLTADCSTAELCRNIKLAPTAGFEPTTDRLTADCSTAELCRNLSVPLSRNTRILTPAFILVKPLK